MSDHCETETLIICELSENLRGKKKKNSRYYFILNDASKKFVPTRNYLTFSTYKNKKNI